MTDQQAKTMGWSSPNQISIVNFLSPFAWKGFLAPFLDVKPVTVENLRRKPQCMSQKVALKVVPQIIE